MNENIFHPLIPVFDDTTEYRHVSSDFVETVFVGDREVLKIDSEGIACLTAEGFSDTSHLLRTSHLKQLEIYSMIQRLPKMIVLSL